MCPGTLSLERHRLLWLYLKKKTKLLEKNISVLHVAPEIIFIEKFRRITNWNYVSIDLNSPLADIKETYIVYRLKKITLILFYAIMYWNTSKTITKL